MNYDEIMSLKVGDLLQSTLDVVPGTGFSVLKENPRWSDGRRIVEITYRGISIGGRAYVGGYTEFGDNGGAMSFSIGEGEKMYRKI